MDAHVEARCCSTRVTATARAFGLCWCGRLARRRIWPAACTGGSVPLLVLACRRSVTSLLTAGVPPESVELTPNNPMIHVGASTQRTAKFNGLAYVLGAPMVARARTVCSSGPPGITWQRENVVVQSGIHLCIVASIGRLTQPHQH